MITNVEEMKNIQPVETNLKNNPIEVKLEVTSRCNAKCSFCFNANTFAKKSRRSDELSTPDWKRIIDKIKEAGIPRIRFTGGEPLMRQDIFELMKYAKEQGLFIKLNTNATLIDKKKAEKIKKYADVVIVSMLSSSNERCSEITKIPNSLSKKINALNLIKSENLDVWICTVATKENINNLEKIFKLVRSLNLDYWFVLRQMPSPKERETPEGDKIRQLIDKLLYFKKIYHFGYDIGSPIPFCVYDPEKSRQVVEGANRTDGRTHLVINPKGIVQPDYCIDVSLGNALTDNITECWKNSFAVSLRNKNNLPLICKKCNYIDDCRGGSRFVTNFVTGSWKDIDPLAEPEKYLNSSKDKENPSY